MKKTLLILTLMLMGCESKKQSASSDAASSLHKNLLSSWSVQPSGVFDARLDLAANTNGTPFMLVFKMSDTSECDCANTVMSGNDSAGTYTVPSCTCGSGIASSFNGVLATGGTGSYSNVDGVQNLCKANGSCNTYH